MDVQESRGLGVALVEMGRHVAREAAQASQAAPSARVRRESMNVW